MTVDAEKSIAGRPFFCSWSGGKDSCLALHHAVRNGGVPRALFTMMSEDGVTSRSHALPKSLIEAQARNLKLSPFFRSASWPRYEEEFISALHDFKKSEVDVGVFGDIDIDEHREWVCRVCGVAGITPVHPLWKRGRQELLNEFIGLGFKAHVIVINGQKLDQGFLGKAIDAQTIAAMEQAGIDPSGELGEYHTVVTDGPLFSSPVEIQRVGQEHHEGYWFLKVKV